MQCWHYSQKLRCDTWRCVKTKLSELERLDGPHAERAGRDAKHEEDHVDHVVVRVALEDDEHVQVRHLAPRAPARLEPEERRARSHREVALLHPRVLRLHPGAPLERGARRAVALQEAARDRRVPRRDAPLQKCLF